MNQHETTNQQNPEENHSPLVEDFDYQTNQDELEDENYVDDGNGSQPRRNLITEVPESEYEFEAKTSEKKKSAPKGLIAMTVILVIAIFSIAMFFIFKGKGDYKETANVKDNSLKLGVGSNSSLANTDFGSDYAERYGANNSPLLNADTNANANTNANLMPGYGTVGNNITAAPTPFGNSTGGIYQPGQMPPVPPANQTSGNSSGGGGGSGFSSGGSPKPVETTRLEPDKSTEVVELAANQYQRPTENRGGNNRNEQVSLYFYERPNNRDDSGRVQKIEFENNAAPRPGFGAVLPVKILGRLHTLGANGLARMELTRAVQGSWGTLPRGTMFVGRVSGGEGNRLFVSLLGYIDSRSNRLVTMGGDLQGRDGALGLEGNVKKIGSRWKKVFGDLFATAREIGTAYLLGRRGGNGTVINTGQVSQLPNSFEDKNATKFVLVPAGSEGYIVINDLPPAIESDERLGANTKELTDEEILKMIQTESPAEIERIIPGLSPRGQQIARGALDK
ncbi:MAG TPA: hypothetical protein VK308_16920 [Pyrinomonadaceae bacterium]|nr:hypothetical protein [Pyrinomonadaceae bacterium]